MKLIIIFNFIFVILFNLITVNFNFILSLFGEKSDVIF